MIRTYEICKRFLKDKIKDRIKKSRINARLLRINKVLRKNERTIIGTNIVSPRCDSRWSNEVSIFVSRNLQVFDFLLAH